ncbi:MAG: hypothetical protein WD995_14285 [Gemmatimonadota bacterium]
MKTLTLLKTAIASTAFLAVFTLFPMTVRGQVLCSAPHSSPTLLESAGERTLPVGQGWVQVATSFNRATDAFNFLGNRQDFLGDAVFQTRSLYLTAAYGLVPGVEIWGQVPVHSLRVRASAGEARKAGIGDLRAAVRLSPAIFGLEAPVAVRVGYKHPGASFPVDATELPLSEGQSDLEVSVESGWQSDRLPVYVAGWTGYRWRSENVDTDHTPGNETFAHLAVGGGFGAIGWQLGLDALWGGAPIDQGLRLTSQNRRLLQIVPSVASNVGPGTLEVSVPVSLSGRNLPAGYTLGLGYRLAWGR